jgi:hypothetical protein
VAPDHQSGTAGAHEPFPLFNVQNKISLRAHQALTGYETAMVDPDGPTEDARVLAEQQPAAAE